MTGHTHTFVVTKTKQPSEAAKIFAKRKEYRMSNTVHTTAFDENRMPAYSIFNRTSPMPSPHYDRKFFDSSLIEMRSQTSSSSTLDCGDSMEDIWVKRIDSDSSKVSTYSIFNSICTALFLSIKCVFLRNFHLLLPTRLPIYNKLNPL